MKTAKILLSILGVGLATLSFGQLLSHHEANEASDLTKTRIMEVQDEVLFYTAVFNAENGRTIHRVNRQPDINMHSWTSNIPLASRMYYAREVEAMYEEIPVVESWMTIPFESSLEDTEPGVEDWMTTPFNLEMSEEVLEIEPWMTTEWL